MLNDPTNLGLLVANLRRAAASDPEIDTRYCCRRAADLLEGWHVATQVLAIEPTRAETEWAIDAVRAPIRPRWEDRLVWDPSVSETSPCIVGTRMTVEHIVSLCFDGCKWVDIRKDHPELTEDDVSLALEYEHRREQESDHV